jgi:hypothetical protein
MASRSARRTHSSYGTRLHPSFVDDRVPPLRRHDVLQGHLLAGGVAALPARNLGVAAQQVQSVHDRPVGRVVAGELESTGEPGEHPAVVGRVRGAQHRPDAEAKGALACRRFLHQVPEGGLAHHRVKGGPHGLVGVLDGRRGQGEQDGLLAPHPAQVRQHLAFDPVLRPRVDPVDQGDQEVNELVGDLAPARPAQGCEQGEADRSWRGPQVEGVGLGRPVPPGHHHLLCDVGEQVFRQGQGPQPVQLVNLGQERLQPELARVGLELPQHAQPFSGHTGLVICGQFLQKFGGALRDRRHCPLAGLLLEAPYPRAHHPPELAGGGRLQALGPAVGDHAVGATFLNGAPLCPKRASNCRVDPTSPRDEWWNQDGSFIVY